MSQKCPSCGGSSLYETRDGVYARGGHGPDLLPGLGGFWGTAKFKIVVCSDCGITQFFASEEARAKLAKRETKWRRL